MFRARRIAILGASSTAVAWRCVASTCSDLPASDQEKATLKQAVVVALSQQSRDNLKEYLDMNKYTGIRGQYVVINKGLTKGDVYQYEPLFGERAAFRLKGIVQNSTNSSAGFGRVAIMSGEIRDEALVASLPLRSENDSFSEATLSGSVDLPTQLSDILVNSEMQTEGPDANSNGTVRVDQADENLNINFFPKMHQIVLEGRLCRADLLDANGNCTFDRSELVPVDNGNEVSDAELDSLDQVPSMVPSESAAIVTEDKYNISDGNEKDDKNECPVCRYIKGGPCKAEFLKWDECVVKIEGDESVKVCFPQTVEMMTCFKKYEYYDIMTAGTRPHLYKQSTEVDETQ